MVTGDMLPLSFVEGEGFQELMVFVEVEYEPPSRQTTKRVERMNKGSVAELRTDLQRVDKVAVTTDCWRALTMELFIH